MHISEGILSAPVLAGGAVLALGGIAKGLKSISEDEIPKAAILAAVFFVASLIHVKVGAASAHLVLSGLMGLFLGWAAFPIIFAGLLLQGLLFQFGGLTVLGVNTFNMAFPAMALGVLLRPAINSKRKAVSLSAAFICGSGAILISAILVALSLCLTGREFKAVALAVVLANLPIMVIEGIISAFVVGFIVKVRPSLLAQNPLDLPKLKTVDNLKT